MSVLEQAAQLAERLQWDEAAKLLATEPATVEVLSKRCFYLSRAKRYDEALELLAELRRREPHVVRWPYMTGYQYYEQQLYAEALPWFEAAQALEADHLKNNYRLAHTYEHLGRQRDAELTAARVLRGWHAADAELQDRERQKFANASYLLGRAQMRRGSVRDALPLLEQAVAHDDADHNKHYRLGKALRLVGRAEEAIVSLRQALWLKPRTTYVEVELAAALADAGKTSDARELLQRVKPHCRGWHAYHGGQVAARVDEPTLAVALLERAARDRDTRGEPRVKEALAAARALASVSNGGESAADDGRATGTVDFFRTDKGFGFLDGDDGTRRYFRLPRGRSLPSGARVSFVAVAADKGPAARELERL